MKIDDEHRHEYEVENLVISPLKKKRRRRCHEKECVSDRWMAVGMGYGSLGWPGESYLCSIDFGTGT